MVDNELITKVRVRNVKSILSNVFTSSGGTITNGNGTTASGSAVDLGGTTTGDILISGDYDIELTEYTDGGADYSTIKLYDGNIDLVYFNSNVTGTETYESLLRFGTSILNRWSRNGGAGVSTVIGDDLNSSGGYGFSVYSVSSGYTPVEADLKFRIGTGGNVTLNLGSDATGDQYHRNSSGYLTRRGVVTATSTATLTVNSDTTYQSCLTAQAEALTIANPTGTPFNGQDLIVRVKDNGTARSITFGAQFRAIGTTLPTTTTAGKVLYICSLWNAADSKWDTVNHLEV